MIEYIFQRKKRDPTENFGDVDEPSLGDVVVEIPI